MTFGQYALNAEGYQIRQAREWERTRFLAAMIINSQGGDVKASDLIALPTDIQEEDEPDAKPIRIMSTEEVAGWIKKIDSITNWKIYNGHSF